MEEKANEKENNAANSGIKGDNEKIREQREAVLKYIGELEEKNNIQKTAEASARPAVKAVKKEFPAKPVKVVTAEKMDFVKKLEEETREQAAVERKAPSVEKDKKAIEGFFDKLVAKPAHKKQPIASAPDKQEAKKISPKTPGKRKEEAPAQAFPQKAEKADPLKKTGRKKLSDLEKPKQEAEQSKEKAASRAEQEIEAAKEKARQEMEKAKQRAGLKRRGPEKQMIDLIPARRKESEEKPKKFSFAASIGKVIHFFSLMASVIILFYLMFSLFVYNSEMDNKYVRIINANFPVPAIVSKEIIIDYYQYKDMSKEILEDMPEAQKEEIEKIILNRLLGDRALNVKAYSFMK